MKPSDHTLRSEEKSTHFPWGFPAIGATLGVAFTLAIILLDTFFAHGESLMSWLLLWPTVVMLWPVQHLFELFGWNWDWISLGRWGGPAPVFPIFVVFVTNAAILSLAGAFVGFLLTRMRR